MFNVLVAQLCPTLCNPTDPLAHQAPLSMGFPRQEYWCGFSFPCPEDLPDLRREPVSPVLQVDSVPLSHITYLR